MRVSNSGVLVLFLASFLAGSCHKRPQPPTVRQPPPQQTKPREAPPRSHQAQKKTKRAPAPPSICRLKSVPIDWFASVQQAVTLKALGRTLRRLRRRRPKGAKLLLTEVKRGLSQPLFVYHSLGPDGFLRSWDAYWPASTIKIMAAVGALMRLSRHKLSSNSELSFRDSYGAYKGSIKPLIEKALVKSDNPSYDRLVRIATIDGLKRHTLIPHYGFRYMSIACPYGGASSLAWTPDLIATQLGNKYLLKGRRAKIPFHRGCPYPQNCTTFFELQESLRRIVFHSQLPKTQRFPLKPADINWLKELLHRAKSPISRVLRRHWRGLKLYHKSGSYPPRDTIENAVLKTRQGTWILTASVQYTARVKKYWQARKALRAWTRTIVQLLKKHREPGVPIQDTAGRTLTYKVVYHTQHKTLHLLIEQAQWSKPKGWWGRTPLVFRRVTKGWQANLPVTKPSARPVSLVLQGFQGKRLRSYVRTGILVQPRPGCAM